MDWLILLCHPFRHPSGRRTGHAVPRNYRLGFAARQPSLAVRSLR